jgi:hypothetical protein
MLSSFVGERVETEGVRKNVGKGGREEKRKGGKGREGRKAGRKDRWSGP